jgi:CHAT domain-containing protein
MRDAQQDARTDSAASPGRFLLVAADSMSQFESLPGAGNVRENLGRLVHPDRLTEISGKSATAAAVLRTLSRHRWAHFDCHSIKHPRNPWHNGLVLHDQNLTVKDFARMRGDRPEFTFLAACVTALTDEDLPDEMVTLAAAMQYTGCQHVIGTLTPPTDRSTTRVTEAVYEAMITRDGIPDPTESARLLHAAICAERARRPQNPSAWAPFIHMGL